MDDGTLVNTSFAFTKVWRMRNDGTTAWPEGCSLMLVGGDSLSPITSVAVPPVPAGEEYDIGVEMVAPATPGRYVSYWRLCCSDGTRFGHRVWVDIIAAPEPKQAEKPAEEPAKPELVQPEPMKVVEPAPAPAPAPVAVPAPEPVKVVEPVPVPAPVAVPAPEPAPVVVVPEPKPAAVPVPIPVPAPVLAPVVPTPAPAPVEPAFEYAQQLQALVEMGFTDVELNKTLLVKYNGDMVRVVHAILA